MIGCLFRRSRMSEYVEWNEWYVVEERHNSDFIKNCEKLMKPEVEENIQKRRQKWVEWTKNNPEKFRNQQTKYFKSEKGRYAISKRSAIRSKYFQSACEGLTKEEKLLIGEFYKNCPKGHEVDHIIPVSKGGKHILSNLQYLLVKDNRRKSNKLIEECSWLVKKSVQFSTGSKT